MLYITGDTHGDEDRFKKGISKYDKLLKKGDRLIVCGDFGYISDNSYKERMFLRDLSERDYQILFVDGNHENFELIEEIPVSKWCGGKVHVIREDLEKTPKIIHLMRGQVFQINKYKIFTFGGGYSIDKERRVPFRSWWPQEMPSKEEMKEALKTLQKNNNKVDFIVTHAAPRSVMEQYNILTPEEEPLNNFLEYIKNTVEYKHFYMGHLHKDVNLTDQQTILYYQMRKIGSNKSY